MLWGAHVGPPLMNPPASSLTTAQQLWNEGGIKRFYKGFTPCIIRSMPANGVMLLTVEKVTALLNTMA
jgi:hypothetical protein